MRTLSVQRIKSRLIAHAALLSDIQEVITGEWFDVYGVHPLTFEVLGIINATVRLFASNSKEEPAGTGIQIGKDITEDLIMILEAPVRWIRATVPVYVSGNISCNLFGSDLGG